MSAVRTYRKVLLRAAQWPANLVRGSYVAGRLLHHLCHDLGDLEFVAQQPGAGEFRSPSDGLAFQVQEHLDARLLLQIVSVDFILRVPNVLGYEGQIVVRHTGHLRRSGLAYVSAPRATGTCEPLKRRLQDDDSLRSGLMPLDFTHCRIDAQTRTLEMRMRHFAASEVVGQLPRFRRYVPLHAPQRDALLATFRAFRNLNRD